MIELQKSSCRGFPPSGLASVCVVTPLVSAVFIHILCDRPAESAEVISPVVSALIPFFKTINNNLSLEDRS